MASPTLAENSGETEITVRDSLGQRHTCGDVVENKLRIKQTFCGYNPHTDISHCNALPQYLRRNGCSDSGNEYEIQMTTLLSLRCALVSNTDDFWVASNVGHVGDFDDIVLCRKTSNGLNIAYLIQLKHQENPEKISNHNFTYKVQRGEKKKRQKSKEDFSLHKYNASYDKMMEEVTSSEEPSSDIIKYLKKCDEIFLIIFTNKLANENSLLHFFPHQELEFLNTNSEEKTIFKFNHIKLDFDQKFLQHLVLFSNQIHLEETRKMIEKEIKNVFSSSKSSNLDFELIAQNLINFIRKIANKTYTLSKTDLIDKLIALALKPYELDFSEDEFSYHNHPGKKIWKELVSKQTATVIDSDDFVVNFLKSCIEDEVQNYGMVSKKRYWDDLAVIENDSLDTKLINLTDETTLFDIYHCLWFNQKVPLLLSIQNNQELQIILKILEHSKSNLSVILLKSETVYVSVLSKKAFFVLNDLNEKSKKVVLSQDVKLQGRSSIVLDKLVSASMHNLIKCNDIIYILANLYDVGYKSSLPDNFIPPRLAQLDSNDHLEFWKLPEPTTWFGFKDTTYQQLNVVTSNPGSGKSTFLNYLASKVPFDFWVLPIVLNEHEDYYYNYPSSKGATHATLFHDGIIKSNDWTNKPLIKALFQEFLQKRKILILLDGFDEVCPHFKNEAVSLIMSLVEDNFNLWITTRPVMAPHLQATLKGLNILFWTLRPFSVEEQEIYLTKSYLSQFGSNNVDEAKEFGKTCLEASKLLFYDRNLNFTASPLYLEVLSARLCTQYKKYGNLGEVSLVEVMEDVINKKSELLCQKFGSDAKRMQIFVKKYQKVSALKATFPNYSLRRLKIDEFLERYLEGKDVELLQRDGVLVPISNTSHKCKFTHRIFADFFAAQWLAENFNSKDKITRNVANGLLKSRFGDFGLVFKMFDGIVSKSCASPTIALGKSWKGLRANLSTMSVKTVFDNLALFPTQIDNVLTKEDFTTPSNAKDAILGYNSLDYAIKTCNFALANELCQKYNFDLHISIPSPLRTCIFSLCVTFRLEHLFRTFLISLGTRAILMDDHDQNYPIELFCNIPNQLQNQNYFHYLGNLQTKTLSDLFVNSNLDLTFAACFGTSHCVESLLPNLNSLNEPDQDDNTLLFYSAKFGRLEVLKMLLVNGADVSRPCSNGNAALHVAAKNGFLDITNELILNKGDVNQTNNFGQTPIFFAVEFKHVEVVNLLVQDGASLTYHDHDDNTLLHYAARSNFIEATIEYSLKYPEISNMKNINGETPLMVALQNKHVECAKILLLSSDVGSKYILHEAAKGGFDEVLEKLLLQGYNVDEQNQIGETSLHVAIKKDLIETSTFLVTFGADCNIKSSHECTPLHCAIQKGWVGLVQKMLSLGASLDINGRFGSTPLHMAVLYNHSELAQIILEHGVDIQAEDEFGNTCLHYAAQLANVQVMSLLGRIGVDSKNIFGRTPLHYAVINEQVEAVRLLLEKGSNLDVKDVYGKTPANYARDSNNEALLCFFKGRGTIENGVNEKIGVDGLTFTLLDEKIKKRTYIDYEDELNYENKSPKENLLMTFLMEYLDEHTNQKS